MTKTQLLEKLAAELAADPAKLTDDLPLTSLSAWDSMGRLATIAMLDAELGFEPEAGALQKCRTVGDLVALVSHKLVP